MKNRIWAIFVAAPAIPPKPNSAATSAITRKIIANLNIIIFLSRRVPSFDSSSPLID
jgi:hypothetical protein